MWIFRMPGGVCVMVMHKYIWVLTVHHQLDHGCWTENSCNDCDSCCTPYTYLQINKWEKKLHPISYLHSVSVCLSVSLSITSNSTIFHKSVCQLQIPMLVYQQSPPLGFSVHLSVSYKGLLWSFSHFLSVTIEKQFYGWTHCFDF